MNLLAINSTIYKFLRLRHKVLIGFIPACMLGAMVGLLVSIELSNVPKVVSLFLMLSSFIFSFLVGWSINALVVIIFLGWPVAKLKSVFGNSDIPSEWFVKDGQNLYIHELHQEARHWENERKIGFLRFIIFTGVVRIGGVALFSIGLYTYSVSEPLSLVNVAISSFSILALCSLIASAVWYIAEMRYKMNK
ncbi:hypothetical protein C2869_11190 [Saccharobesus litoralis]|uniref:Uncharacterized protein n=1 Tax=Saccharobesus litoralis TaxID=2172099 RepID=A0A2S0VRX4_9ALTE|nr:hypothetical protein [Saccharobesus litoralis]AWB66966.1 hypothetical protein C2869_11190 [Saccharobesus litoralis]